MGTQKPVSYLDEVLHKLLSIPDVKLLYGNKQAKASIQVVGPPPDSEHPWTKTFYFRWGRPTKIAGQFERHFPDRQEDQAGLRKCVKLACDFHKDRVTPIESTPRLHTQATHLDRVRHGLLSMTGIASLYDATVGNVTVEVIGPQQGYLWTRTIYYRWAARPGHIGRLLPDRPGDQADLFECVKLAIDFHKPKPKAYGYEAA